LHQRVRKLLSGEMDLRFKTMYQVQDSSGYPLLKRLLNAKFDKAKIHKISYRFFDVRNIYYDKKLISRAGYALQRHLLEDNLALVLPRLCKGARGFQHGMVVKNLVDRAFGDAHSGAGTNVFPLYRYPQIQTEKVLSIDIETKKIELQNQLKLAKQNYIQTKKFFNKTVLPFYKAITAPNEAHEKLFEENKTQYEEAKAILENIQQQLNKLNEYKNATHLDELTASPLVKRVSNLNKKLVQEFEQKTNLQFVSEKESTTNTFSPVDVLDYIYAWLHSPAYREAYKEFLKIDFPRVPYPQNAEQFWQLVEVGSELRQIHLLESPKVAEVVSSYQQDGSNLVSKVAYEDGKVWINESQYFDNVPLSAWAFYIGGYQPAQKWLKDRKDRQLGFEDIVHYQKIIAALSQTEVIMQKIDKIVALSKL
jgi:predicted helicase